MSSASSKSMRLHFKGDKAPKKKHKSRNREGSSRKRGDADDGVESDVETVGGDDRAWVNVERPEDIAGPLFLYQPLADSGASAGPSRFAALSLNPTMSRMVLAKVSPPAVSTSLAQIDGEELEGATVVQSEDDSALSPTEVHQVLVSSRVLDTADPPRYTFRTTENRFLGADKHGTVLCSAEARGPQEEWAIISAGPGGIALRNYVHETFLSSDEVAGGKLVLRADAKEVGEGEVWRAKAQWKFRHEARKGERAREIGKGGLVGVERRLKLDSGPIDEHALAKSRQSFTGGKVLTYSSGDSKQDRKDLKRAMREGRMAEELLNRRSKLKHDKFA